MGRGVRVGKITICQALLSVWLWVGGGLLHWAKRGEKGWHYGRSQSQKVSMWPV